MLGKEKSIKNQNYIKTQPILSADVSVSIRCTSYFFRFLACR